MQFVLLIYQPADFDPKSLSNEEYAAVAADYGAVSSAPNVVSGPPLGFTRDAVTVRVQKGEAIASAGPFAGEAGAVGGYLVFEAESIDEAVELASRIPAARLGGAVEVRPCAVYW